MNRTILYYPTIDIPNTEWLKHALLYWDEVSSIIPKSHDNKLLVKLSPDIHYLMDENQFRPIQPEDLVFKQDNWQVFEQFQKEFKKVVSDPTFNKFRKKGRFRLTSRIHSNKSSDSLYDFVAELGLAKHDDDYEWIKFERKTALLYMSLLAKYLADIDANHTTIGTDYAAYEGFNFKKVGPNNGFPVVSFDLNNILPTPRENVPLKKIIDFKRKRADNLRHFKQHISDFQSKISKAESNAELKEHTINFRDNIINGVNDLTAVLKDSRVDSTFKTFRSLINLKSPTMIAAAGAVLNNELEFLQIPVDLAGIGLGVMAGMELTGKYIEARNKTRAKLRESSFSYLYHAGRKGIIAR